MLNERIEDDQQEDKVYILRVSSIVVSEYHIVASSEEEAHSKVKDCDPDEKIGESITHIMTKGVDRW